MAGGSGGAQAQAGVEGERAEYATVAEGVRNGDGSRPPLDEGSYLSGAWAQGGVKPGMTPAPIELRGVSHQFRDTPVLRDVSLAVPEGGVHALLGPNGAGKTTLIRVVAGLLVPNAGSVRVMGIDATRACRATREAVGLVPSGDRSFYLRISGLENLAFFARLHGMRRKAAIGRALELLEQVGLREAARMRVGLYSHGMQKRLSVARALLMDPPVLLVDEGTHDLDPAGAERVRELVAAAAHRGAAVLWATQRIDEIRELADSVTLLAGGKVRFAGTVAELMSEAAPRHVVRLRNCRPAREDLLRAAVRALGRMGTLSPDPRWDPDQYVLALAEDVVLGDALGALAAADIQVLNCREERSQLEEAFHSLTCQVAR